MFGKYFTGISILLASVIVFTGLVITRGNSSGETTYVRQEDDLASVADSITEEEVIVADEEDVTVEDTDVEEEEIAKPVSSKPKPTYTYTPPVPTKNYLTLPSGEVVEIDENGNIVGSSIVEVGTSGNDNIVLPNGTVIDSNGNVVTRAPGDNRDYLILPSGAVIDSDGNIILSANGEGPNEVVPFSMPEIGDTVNISRDITTRIGFNPSLDCDKLGFGGDNLTLCDLYRNHYSDYTWNVTD